MKHAFCYCENAPLIARVDLWLKMSFVVWRCMLLYMIRMNPNLISSEYLGQQEGVCGTESK